MKIKLLLTIFLIASSASFAAEENFDDEKVIKKKENESKKLIEDEKGIFSLILENDAFTGTDRGYTNGVRLSYITPEENMPRYVQRASDYLPVINAEGKKRISLAAGQSMYTPGNIAKKEYIPNDFPYAGWLYASLGLISDSGKSYDNIILTLGMIGPASLAEDTQKFVHHNTPNSVHPQGWDNQIKNEPGLVFTYERKWRNILEAEPFGVGIDAVPHIGVNLGNVLTNASVGVTLRLGYDLPADYGPPRIRPSLPGSDFFIPAKKLGGYLFIVLEERAIARNIFLDGNTFRDSNHVHKRNFVGSNQFGAAVTYKDFRISYSYILVGKEFKGQHKGSRFGAFTFSYRF